MIHYTYLLKDKGSGMQYIGVRSCEGIPEDDFYWGSSKHLPDNVSEICEKVILQTFPTRKEAVANEVKLHDEYDVATNPLFWNRAKQTSHGFDTQGTTYKKENTQNYIGNTNAAGTPSWNSGMSCPEISERQTGSKNSFAGKTHTKEWRTNHSSAMAGTNNPMYGKKMPTGECIHCKKVVSVSAIVRFHNDNCKGKRIVP